jgi:hypothetical protein
VTAKVRDDFAAIVIVIVVTVVMVNVTVVNLMSNNINDFSSYIYSPSKHGTMQWPWKNNQ